MATRAISSAAAPRIHLFRDDVNAELVRYLYRQAPGSMIAIVIVGCILTFVLWNTVSNSVLLAWLLSLAAVWDAPGADCAVLSHQSSQEPDHALGRRLRCGLDTHRRCMGARLYPVPRP